MSSSKNGNGNGKTICKEVCSKCKCIVIEKPIKETEKEKKEHNGNNGKKQECVATIVGVLSLPENFCNGGNKKDDSKQDDCDFKMDDCNDNTDKKEECAEVYRDLGECLQKCIVKTSKSSKGHGSGNGKAKSKGC